MKLNEVDHIWLLLILFALVLAVWLFTKATWLETSGGNLIVAIVAVATTRKAESKHNPTTLDVMPTDSKE